MIELGVKQQAKVDGRSPLPADLVESLSDLLASMLIEEWKVRHCQQGTETTVNSPGGLNHDDSRGIRWLGNQAEAGHHST